MFTVDLTLEASVRRQTAVVCHSAWGPNADRRANSLTCPRKQGSTLEADLHSGYGDDNAFGGFPRHWDQIFKDLSLSDVTPHVLRHSFATLGNDLGFTEMTIAALVGHAKGSVTSNYIHTLDTVLIMAADTIVGYIAGLLDGKEFKQTAYALDRDSRKAALARFLHKASGDDEPEISGQERLAA